jgi:hypothetical protein
MCRTTVGHNRSIVAERCSAAPSSRAAITPPATKSRHGERGSSGISRALLHAARHSDGSTTCQRWPWKECGSEGAIAVGSKTQPSSGERPVVLPCALRNERAQINKLDTRMCSTAQVAETPFWLTAYSPTIPARRTAPSYLSQLKALTATSEAATHSAVSR